MKPEIQEKINALRDSLKGGDPTALQQVATWENDLHIIFEREKYFENPITQTLVADARKQIDSINIKLLDPKRLETSDRDALIAERKGYEWYLRLIDRDFGKMVDSIEKSIDFELEPSPVNN